MANEGSPLSMQEVVNTVEKIFTIREGQIRCYVKDITTGLWVPESSVPPMPAPASTFSTVAQTLSDSAATQFPAGVCKRCVVIAHRDNTGLVWVGGSTVSNVNGIPLEPGQAQELSIGNTNLIYAVAEVNAEKVIIATLG
jgi:hypothetical protein